jgi:light-regulated signal transduction histidine kinase (bacteriophytochrome)
VLAFGDKALLHEALHQLIANAWKYTTPVSNAAIEFGTIHDAYVSDAAGAQSVYFVRDNGVGFDQALADKLFRPFGRLHPQDEFQGAGMGLTVTRRIVHRHGGWISGTAQPGKGAEFLFALPGCAANTGEQHAAGVEEE